jgi:hypothetical protein
MNGTRKLRRAAAVWLFLAGVVAAAPGRIIYVDDSADGPNHGHSWTDALLFLQDALTLAEQVQEPVEIRIAQGLYKPDQGTGITPGDREATFSVPPRAVLLGGYAGIGATDPNERNVERYMTILSGDLLGDDPQISEASELADAPNRLDNSFHVVTMLRVGFRALDGLFIRDGHAPDGGGGLQILQHGQGSPTLRSCTFTRNWAADGGAVAVWGDLRYVQDDVVLQSCTFQVNASQGHGGGVFVDHGKVSLRDCEFTANTAHNGGGLASGRAYLFVSDCTFIKNAAVDGGAMHRVSGNLTVLSRCRFTGNVAYENGGVLNTNRRLNCVGCVFDGNFAMDGPAVVHGYGDLFFRNCTVVSNRSLGDYVFYAVGGRRYLPAIVVSNCIVRGNTPGPDATGLWPEHASVIYSDVQDGWPVDGTVPARIGRPAADGAGLNVDVDPCFVNPGYWDPSGTPDDPNDDVWVAGDYHLKSQAGRWDPATESWVRDGVTSPCIDAGDPAGPVGDELFPNGGRVNMGAYGGTTQASKSYFGEPVCDTHMAGDINGDCKVDLADLLIVVSQWTDDVRYSSPVIVVEPPDGAELQIKPDQTILIGAKVVESEFPAISVRFKIRSLSDKFGYDSSVSGRRRPDGWYHEWYWRGIESADPGEVFTFEITAEATDETGRKKVSKPVVITIRRAQAG